MHGPSLFPDRPSKLQQRLAHAPLNVTQILRDIDRLEQERQQRLPEYRDIYSLMMPNRDVIKYSDVQHLSGGVNWTKGLPTNTELYDSMPAYLLARGAANLIGAIQPPERKYVKLEAGPAEPEEDHDKINEFLEPLTDTLFDFISNSDDATQSLAMSMDLMVSHGAMTVEEGPSDDEPFSIRAWPAVNVLPIIKADGTTGGAYRRYNVEAGHVNELWPRAKLTPQIAQAAQQDPKKEVCVLECEWATNLGRRFAVLDGDAQKVMLDVTPQDATEPSKWIIPRMGSLPGEAFGRGPACVALPDARTINKLQEIELKGAWRNTNPPLVASADSGMNPDTFRVGPNAVNILDTQGQDIRSAVMALNAQGNPQFGLMKIEEKRQALEKVLFAEPVVPPLEQLPNLNASAIAMRRQALLAERGVDLGQVQREFIQAKIRRMIWILQKKRLFPPIRVDNRSVRIRYVGPLAQAQDIQESNDILQYVGDVTNALGAEAAMVGIKTEDVAEIVGKLRGVPSSIIRDEQERAQMQANIGQMAAGQAAA